MSEIIVDALEEFLRLLFSPITDLVQTFADDLVKMVVTTPHPDAVFTAPTNGPWPGLYEYYWSAIVPLSLSLFGLSIGLVIFLESTSHLFSNFHRSKLKKRSFAGLLGILSWWWVGALALRFTDALTGFLVPNLSDVSLFQTLSFTSIGVLGVAISLSADFVLFVLIALIYFTRQVALYAFMLTMPLVIAVWIPGVGPFGLVAAFAKRMAGFFIPFLFMTVPVAILFRLGEILGAAFDLSMKGFGAWLTALVIPFVAVASPFILFWQAGALFFMADRMSNHVSKRRARTRITHLENTGQTTAHGGRNFARGARGRPAIRRDGQYLLGDQSTRAHAAGARLHVTGRGISQAVGRSPGVEADGESDDQRPPDGGRVASRDETFESLRRDSSQSTTSNPDSKTTSPSSDDSDPGPDSR
ncbi:hypothetical protein ACFQE1_03325 [Halobium palmae]|uniref:Uncharacterized protein n=1 Tax=Halobium palmae TaxID=1776492 RepID=A0ABD5RW42_9EURY